MSSKGKKLYIRVSSKDMQIRAFVDAAFALHFDAKSHTGTVVTIGGAVVYVSSRKQKCMTGSPTEAELVGLTDNLGIVGLFREFVSFLIGEQAKVPIVYQDSTSVISLITLGGGITRTKHLTARMYIAKELVELQEILVCYLNTKDMPADGASKALEGKGQKDYANFVLGVKGFSG